MNFANEGLQQVHLEPCIRVNAHEPQMHVKENSRPQHLHQLNWSRLTVAAAQKGAAPQQRDTYGMARRETSCMRMRTAWEAALILRVWSSTFEVKCRTNLEEWSGFSCVCTRGPLMILLPHFSL